MESVELPSWVYEALADYFSNGDLSRMPEIASAIRQATSAEGDGGGDRPSRDDIPAPFADRAYVATLDFGPESLDIAIGMWRSVVEDSRFGAALPQFRARVWNDLAMRYYARCGARGEIEDLNAAIEAQRAAIGVLPDGVDDAYTYYKNLSLMLSERSAATDDVGDLDDAMQAVIDGVATTPPGSPAWAGGLAQLMDLARSSGTLHPFDVAIDYLRNVLADDGAATSGRPLLRALLALSTGRRARASGQAADCDEALRLIDDVLRTDAAQAGMDDELEDEQARMMGFRASMNIID